MFSVQMSCWHLAEQSWPFSSRLKQKFSACEFFSRARPLFLQTSIRISSVLHSNYASVLFNHQIDETKSEYIDPVSNESMLSPMFINRDLCKNELHLNVSLQTRACLRNRGAGWRFSRSRGGCLQGPLDNHHGQLDRPPGRQALPHPGQEGWWPYGGQQIWKVKQHRWLLSSNKQNHIYRKNIQEKDVPFIERLPLSLNHLVSNGASSKGQKVCCCCVSFSFYYRCLYCRLAWTSWCPWLRAWGSLTKTRYFTTSQILDFYDDW